MDIYKLNNKRLESVESVTFDSEKEIQSIVENNSEELFNLTFVKSEVTCEIFRFDSLCWDEENNSFVIIEYKNSKSSSVIDQGYSYLSTMLNNKSDFILEYIESMDKSLKKENVDWSQSRVIFVSTSFTEYQKNSVNFKDVPFELWEIQKFSNGTLGLSQVMSNSKESIKGLEKGKTSVVSKVSQEIVKYDEESVITKHHTKYLEIYNKLKQTIIEWDGISIKTIKRYVCFYKGKRGFLYVTPKKDCLDIGFGYRIDFKGNVESKPKPFKFNDPEGKFTLKKDKFREVYRHNYTDKSNLDYIIYCVKQKYDSMK